MTTIEVEELQARLVEVLGHVQRERQVVEITSQDRPVARVVPVEKPDHDTRADVWSEMQRLTEELARYLPSNVDAVEAINDVRREL